MSKKEIVKNALSVVLVVSFVFVGITLSGKKEKAPEYVPFSDGGFVLPIEWGNVGQRMVEAGVIDREKFISLYKGRGGLEEDMMKLLDGGENNTVVMTDANAGVLLNFFWALGLSNKSDVLTKGEMSEYGDPARFASTGGWTIARGNAMEHYSVHDFVALTPAEEDLVASVARGIYRPCCGNSTHFPDCNHGMAMLGLLELLAANGLSENEMFDVALAVNSYWFPDTYRTLREYFEGEGVLWEEIDPKVVLGPSYSSGAGYRKVLEEMESLKQPQGSSCGA